MEVSWAAWCLTSSLQAGKHGIKVLIDLHGLPGGQVSCYFYPAKPLSSQSSFLVWYRMVRCGPTGSLGVFCRLMNSYGSGFDNSGQRDVKNWADNQSYQDRTKAIIKTLVHEFSQNKYANAVSAIAPVNEPAPWFSNNAIPAAKSLFEYSYQTLRKPFSTSTPGNLLLVLQDAFQSLDYWNGYMSYPGHDGVAMDVHSECGSSSESCGVLMVCWALPQTTISGLTSRFRIPGMNISRYGLLISPHLYDSPDLSFSLPGYVRPRKVCPTVLQEQHLDLCRRMVVGDDGLR